MKKIEQLLLEKGTITQNQIAWAHSRRDVTNERVVNILVGENIVRPEEVARAWAELYQLDYVDLDKISIDPEVLLRVPDNIIRAYQFVPIEIHDDDLVLAVPDPSDSFAIESIKMVTGMNCRIRVASKSAVDRKILEIMDRSGQKVEGRSTRLSNVPLESLIEDVNVEFVEELKKEVDLDLATSDGDHTPVITLVNKIIQNAVKMRASDIHIDVFEKNLVVKYRIDGVLQEQMQLERKAHNAIISRIKVIANLDITEKIMPQDSSFKMKADDSQIDFRVSVLPSYYGQNIVIRVLNRKTTPLNLTSLGFQTDVVESLRKSARRPYGLILVTGPTGSGKTTTLYSTLNEMNAKQKKIITIENPIEFQIPGVHQMQVNINPLDNVRSLTFARGLRSILRHDPDIIMIGEIRDSETADIAIQAASTGHLVLSTIHANTSLDVVGRFLSLDVDRYLFTNCLNVIMAQRLVRTICPYCKMEREVTANEARMAGLDISKMKGRRVNVGKGCQSCNGTGYLGRTAICEYIEIDDDIRQLVDEKASFVKIRRAAVEKGMKTLRESCIEKVLKGQTSIEEFINVIGEGA
ncbi:MAG: pilus assembly protein PilB [Candidatus Wallbacteria bacterium HGW-Wallbacteria-1]|jgi:type IV pilus assembly protein PilB|uniref:Pilus assembly protein PilB n=1 Tax=Candidatus Wallbacteria bacterium HGW-Wallbacteria-1 TaxID=2013854 RepID=A0A2N1PQQ6_9BACT|nr:MAG: pilus assembly protein PilB [Candidatus Wallbacteria bacterium HGW-Wallbacteria-1]